QDHVQVDVEVDRRRQGVQAECPYYFGKALLDGHAPRIVFDERFDSAVVIVGDDGGGRVAAQAGDDELADGPGVFRQFHPGGLVDAGPGVLAGAVQGDRNEGGGFQAGDLLDEARRADPQGEELDAAVVEFAEDGLGGDLLVHDQHVR